MVAIGLKIPPQTTHQSVVKYTVQIIYTLFIKDFCEFAGTSFAL